MDNPENVEINEEQMAEDFGQKVAYIRQWLDCAPDFPVLFQVLLLKLIVDRNGRAPTPEETTTAERWVENFYKDLSAIMGTLEGHILLSFPPGARGPHAELTQTGKEWMQQNIPPQEMQPGSTAEENNSAEE